MYLPDLLQALGVTGAGKSALREVGRHLRISGRGDAFDEGHDGLPEYIIHVGGRQHPVRGVVADRFSR